MTHTVCLSIAGFDGSSGAGIQADLKTFSALGCYAMTVLTALPVQNTCGVKHCYDISTTCINQQLDTLFADIIPHSIKIGMLFSADIIETVATFLEKNACGIPIILDPVMVAKSGDPLLLADAVECLKQRLIPLSTLITPNIPEAQALLDNRTDELEKLGEQLLLLNPDAVLVKGGHHNSTHSNDLLIEKSGAKIKLHAKRINSKNTHGTGCTLSAAIAAFIARGHSITSACKHAKLYLFHAIQSAQNNSVGHGNGPVNHFYHIWPEVDNLLNLNREKTQ